MSGATSQTESRVAVKRDVADDKISPLAIVGMAIRLSGGVNSPGELWEFLLKGRDACGPIPLSRYNGASFFDPSGKPGTAAVKAGYFLDRDLELFDAAAFPMSRPEIELLDPSQRQLLEIVRECLESAGEVLWQGKDIGCFVGTFGEDWQDLRRKDTQDYGAHRMVGSSDFAASNRTSYMYDFRGPSVTTRTACSASLIALHAACQALYQGDCSAAIVAGANLILSPTNTSGLSEVGALSPDASCRTFDIKANGYARAEGVAALYIKPLSDAIACNDPIRAVIRSTASNSDGNSSSFSSPNSDAHKSLMRKAYQRAGLMPEQTAFVELHGTGTAVGDPIEAGAVAEVFGNSGLHIGSIKPNVGHTEGASGIVSVIKAVLALEHQIIPPNIKFNTPNPKIPCKKGGLVVLTNPMPWPSNKKERVSVNSFGLGGSNAHAILESARSMGAGERRQTSPCPKDKPRLLVLSADHPKSLESIAQNCDGYLQQHSESIDDLLYTLNVRREHRRVRSFSIYDGTQLLAASRPTIASDGLQIVFVFTGQGAQYLGMARSFAMCSDQFTKDLEELDKELSRLADPPQWSIRDLILGLSDISTLGGVISQPLCTAIQIALVNQLRAWGVHPNIVVGHSSGEIAAAYTAGAITMRDAIALSYHRGQSLPSTSGKGGMAAVGMGRAEVMSYLQPGLMIGCENSPSNVTLSGDLDVLKRVVVAIQEASPETFVRVLNVDMAYHSDHMKEVSTVYAKALTEMSFGSPKVSYFSTAYGRWLSPNDVLGLDYWKANLESPVLFDTAIRWILKDAPGPTVFLEVGPHSALKAPLRQCFQSYVSTLQPIYIPTLVKGEDSYQSMLAAMGMLHCAGAPIELSLLTFPGRVLHDLAPYPFNYERIIRESRISKSWRFRKHGHHDLLGVPILENNDLEPTWRNTLRLTDVPWICDHRIGADIVCPAAAYIAMAGEAFCQLSTLREYTVRSVNILAAMVLHEHQAAEILTNLRPYRWTETQLSRAYEFTISSFRQGTWTTHCFGQVQAPDSELQAPRSIVEFPRKVRARHWYAGLRRSGIEYGPAFAGLDDMACSVDTSSACASTSAARDLSGSSYPVHPTLIDQTFQLLSLAHAQGFPRSIRGTNIPVYIRELHVKTAGSALSVRADATPSEQICGSVAAWSNGKIILSGHGIQMSRLDDLRRDPGMNVYTGARLEYLPLLRCLDFGEVLQVYEDDHAHIYSNFLTHFVHENCRAKVLEICWQPTSATECILQHLYSKSGVRMFASYTFASPSEDALAAVKSEHGRRSTIQHVTLDPGKDPAKLGFSPRSYDLIVAHGLTLSAQDDQCALKNMEKLLKPSGYLLVDESLAKSDAKRFDVAGLEQTISDDTLFKIDSQTLAYDYRLQNAGLTGQVVSDRGNILILAQPNVTRVTEENVTLLVPLGTSAAVAEVVEVLLKHGVATSLCTLEDIPPPGSTIISLLDIENPLLFNIKEHTFRRLTRFLSKLLSQQKMIWLTKASEPEYSLIHGFSRNIRFELGLDLAILEMEDISRSCIDVLPSFIQKYRYNTLDSDVIDFEYAIVDNCITVGRFHWFSIDAALSQPSTGVSTARLHIARKGALQSLSWVPDLAEDEPGPLMIEVDIKAVGLNFKDVLVAMGIITGTTLGIEASGIVTRTGTDVNDIQPGDRVAIAQNGCFVTQKTVSRSHCVRIPDGNTLGDAATLYGVYCTSLLALRHIAKISSNSTVLIHSAAGGIGLSAIQICRFVGAEIYATVGNERKREFLQNTFGIPAENIFSSRNGSFKQQLLGRTKQRGVDVVLNSLSGELLHLSWDCIADFGVMIELGRRDIQERGKLSMANFSHNRSYCAVDYAQILDEKPELNQQLMQEVTDLLREGKIAPIAPVEIFTANEIENCFRFLQKGDHIGKVVVHMPETIEELHVQGPLRQDTTFNADAAYLLVGGLGGLGRAVSVWMAERGARHLVYMARSGLSAAKLDTLNELAAMGCTYQVFRGSATHAADVQRMIHETTRPIRGVLQMSADLKDSNISDMTYAHWHSGTSAKVQGTLNIHNALSRTHLDFFIMFSSHVGLHGWYGQANYAAGNTFCDAFVQYRHSKGMPASVLNIGAVEDIGMTSENPDLARRMRSTFRHFLPEQDFFDALELAIARSKPGEAGGSQTIAGLQPSVSAADSNSNLPWANDARFQMYANIEEDMSGETTQSSTSTPLSDFLASCSRDPSVLDDEEVVCSVMSREILFKICSFLTIGKEEQEGLIKRDLANLSLADLGVDSLVGIELRNWWRQRLGVEITVLQILDSSTVAGLGGLAVGGLRRRFEGVDGCA